MFLNGRKIQETPSKIKFLVLNFYMIDKMINAHISYSAFSILLLIKLTINI